MRARTIPVLSICLAATLLTLVACRGAEGPAGPTGPGGRSGPPPSTDELTALVNEVLDERAALQSDPSGLTGDQGLRGLQGPKGDRGRPGPIGPEGDVGPLGPPGPEGPDGPEGSPGPEGPEGPDGPEGVRGLQGTSGPQGPRGAVGPLGLQGATGPMGPAGASIPDPAFAVAVNSPALGYPLASGPRLGTNPPWKGWSTWQALQSVTLTTRRAGWVFVIATGQSEQTALSSQPASVGLALASGQSPDVGIDIWARSGETVMQAYTVTHSYHFDDATTQTFYFLAAGVDVIMRPGSLTAIFIPDAP